MKTCYNTLLIILLILLRTQILFPQWTQTNGPGGGQVNCLTVCGNNIFAGSDGGVFFSSNDGISWNKANNGLANVTVQSFTVSGNSIFAGTKGNGIYLSTNNGAVWTQINNGLTMTNVLSLA